MKRHDNIYPKICTLDNLMLAHQKARRGKRKKREVKRFEANLEQNLLELQQELMDKTYKIGPYKVFKIYEPKERDISMLAYRDRIVQHAIMNELEGILVSTFTADTYSSIKERGVHKAGERLKKDLRRGLAYYAQIDVVKFYPSVKHEILKATLCRKIKDADLLRLLNEIIDSAPGLPIGNYLSQYLSNLYLNGLDHFIKEVLRAKHYFRYADDMILLANDKPTLHRLLAEIKKYLNERLQLEIKPNYRIAPVSTGIDAFGYVYFPDHTLVRKSIKQECCRMLKKNRNPQSINSYLGWFKHANCRNLENKLNMNTFKDFGIKTEGKGMEGDKIKIERLFNREISVHSYKVGESKIKDKGSGKCLQMQIAIGETMHVIFTGSLSLIQLIEKVPKDAFPFKTTIIKDNDRFLFT